MADTLTCPDCGGTASRDRRFLTEGRTPFICRRDAGGCGAWIVDDNEPVQRPEGGFVSIPQAPPSEGQR